MYKKNTYVSALISLALFCGACTASIGSAEKGPTTAAPAPGTQSPATATGDLKYKSPDGWIIEKPSSGMRMAQFKLPKVAGDSDDAALVLYFFGSGQGGSVTDNIDRWVNQMQQPDGKPSKEKAKIQTLTVNGLKITTVDVSGTYTAQMSPGSDTRHNDSNQRLLAAVVETPKGNYFAKLTGPEKTVSRWSQSFTDYINSFEFNKHLDTTQL